MEAARRLYQASGADEKTLEAMGLPAGIKSFEEQQPCLVWAKNWKTVELFIALSTQWRVGMNGATGLDYSAIAPTAAAMGIRLTPSRFEGVRAMERVALEAMRAQ